MTIFKGKIIFSPARKNHSSEIVLPEKIFNSDELDLLKKWISRYKSPLFFFLHERAEFAIKEFDRVYFERSGVTEQQYIKYLEDEAVRLASLRFTDFPVGEPDFVPNAFRISEAEAKAHFAEIESRVIKEFRMNERRLPFKAYVARRIGFRFP